MSIIIANFAHCARVGEWEMTQISVTKCGCGVPYSSLFHAASSIITPWKSLFFWRGLLHFYWMRGERERWKRESGRRKLFWGRVANSKMFISKVNDILKWHKLIISANERGRERESERDKATVTASGVKTAQIEAEMEGERERERGVTERALSVLKQSAFYFNLLI